MIQRSVDCPSPALLDYISERCGAVAAYHRRELHEVERCRCWECGCLVLIDVKAKPNPTPPRAGRMRCVCGVSLVPVKAQPSRWQSVRIHITQSPECVVGLLQRGWLALRLDTDGVRVCPAVLDAAYKAAIKSNK